MAVYGQYETVAEVGRTRASAVHRARPADGGWDLGFDDLGSDAGFAVKVMLVRNAAEAGEEEGRRFLARARDQKRAGDAHGARHWAPVIEAGRIRGESYYVTRYFPSSAAKLAAAGPLADARALYEIVSGILQGLLELRKTLGRPHGNLKTGNVLLRTSAGKSVCADDIVLTDPADEHDAVIGGEVEDLFTVGEIIHELVLGRPFPGQHTWPVPPGEAWTKLGKTGENWRALVNHVLSPRAAENWLRVDDILEELRALAPRRRARTKPPSKKKRALVVAAALVVGAGTFEYFRYQRIWHELCTEYNDWVDPTSRALAAGAPKALSDDPYIRERLLSVIEQARHGQIELDPRDIASSDQPLPFLAERPPLSLPAIWKAEKARWAVAKMAESLSGQQLRPVAEVYRRRSEYQTRGWARLAEYTKSVIDAAPQRPSADTVAALVSLLESDARLSRLDAARDAARTRLNRLLQRADQTPVIKEKIVQFATLVRMPIDSDAAIPTADGVDSLARQLAEAERVGATFEALVGPLAEAGRRQRGYEVRGWSGAARHLGTLIDRASPRIAADSDLASLGHDLSAARDQWEVVESTWAQIETRRRLLESSGDRMLTTYRAYVAAQGLGEAPDLITLARRVRQINEDPQWEAAARKVASPEWANFDVVAFATRSKAHAGFLGRSAPTSQDMETWLAEVDGHGARLASSTIKPDSTLVTPPTQPATLPSADPATRPVTVAVNITPGVGSATKPATEIASATNPGPTVATTQKVIPDTPPQPPVDPERVRLETEIAAFVIDCREVGLAASTREVKEAWRARCEQLAQGVLKDYKSFTTARARRDRLRQRLLQVDGVARSTAAPLDPRPLAAAGGWRGALVSRLGATTAPPSRLSSMIELAVSEDGKFDDSLREWVDADEQWRAAAARLVADAGRIEDLLARGHAPSDKTTDGASPASLASALGASELLKDPATRAALDPILKPLATVQAETDPAALRAMSAAADLPLGLRLAAWSRLSPEPTRAAFDADSAAAAALLAAAQKSLADDPSRAESVKTRLETDTRARWEALLSSGKTDADIAHAIAQRDKVTGVVIDRLPARGRLNLALNELRQSAGDAGPVDLERIAPAARKLREIAAADASIAAEPCVAALLAEFDAIARPASVDFSKLGPMSEAARATTGGRVNWTVRSEDPAVVSYRAPLGPDGKEDAALVFRRVTPSGASAGGATYVLTTEVSLALFDDLLTAAGRWRDVRSKSLLPVPAVRGQDPRPGPRTWEWPRYGHAPGVTRSLYWLSPDFIRPGLDHYPETIGGEFNRAVIRDPVTGEQSAALNPTRRQPMQYVTPAAAQLAAAVAGCRLPTTGEWVAAYKSVPDHTGANLRDRTWRLQLEHTNKPQFAGKARPDAGIFTPAGERASDAVFKTPTGAEYDDGILWFREVPAAPPATFVDLAGNVAELVTDESAGKTYVIGASSLSPPERPLDKPFELSADQSTGGFADVGFRLAFSLPAPTLDKLKDAVAGNWYLTGK